MVLRGDADHFDGHSRPTPSSANAAVDGADVVAGTAAIQAGEVTISTTFPIFLS